MDNGTLTNNLFLQSWECDCSWQRCVCSWWLMPRLLCFVLDPVGIVVFWALIPCIISSKMKKRTLHFILPHIGVVTYYTTSCFFNFHLPSLVSSPAQIAFILPLDTAGWHRAAARKWRLASCPCLQTFPPASQIPAMTVVCINALINKWWHTGTHRSACKQFIYCRDRCLCTFVIILHNLDKL